MQTTVSSRCDGSSGGRGARSGIGAGVASTVPASAQIARNTTRVFAIGNGR